MIAQVAVSLALGREFDYTVPESLATDVTIGSRVQVPFGRRRIEGYVVGLAAQSAFPNLKAIGSVLGTTPFLDERMLQLVRWMADYYCAPLELCIRTVLPAAVRVSGREFKQRLWVARPEPEAPPEPAVPAVASRPERAPQMAALTAQQRQVLDVLAEHGGGMWLQELLRAAQTTQSPVKTLAAKGLVVLSPREQPRDPLAGNRVLPSQPLDLSPEQQTALAQITDAVETRHPGVVLLYGVTGSGKTEVYLQAIARVLEAGGGAIVLVPEIALTPQTVARFQSRFGEQIAVLHSHLSDGERHDEWHRIQRGAARVVIGARSAVFAPVRMLRLIVVDEEHEPSYKQADAPRYNARDLAVMRGRLLDCAVVLGSATPSLESWNNVLAGKYARATLSQRVDNRTMPHMRIVDMRIEAQRNGHPSVFSQELLQAMEARLERGEQTILFLNRRGFSASLVCPKCGYVSECNRCSVACTYHRTDESLRCHLCGHREPVPAVCPGCRDPAFRMVGVGTQRVEQIARTCFPHARIDRMDADTTTRRNAYERILGAFRGGKTDILIGTQMIAKGLHFPGVTLVGIVHADLSLHIPDFRAGERTFQLLAQVAGRAGRGDVAGEVIVQTYTPHHAAVQAARRLDYEGFCAMEVEFRKELLYPPFAHLIAILLRGRIEPRVKLSAETVAGKLRAALPPGVIVSEATPAPLARVKEDYRYQVMIRSRSVKRVVTALKTVFAECRFPTDVQCQVDVDAISLM
jgi:primosomal protein N' (replication factor Y) (superfamily II helicase)